ncbi:MAG: Protein grpE [uncultured bacterium (gcode 4)]|uniref:Protein GrpE n=1 Tax=uncultured bacterium (gcode 4) TaxID=1234023 RepID=K2GWW6_9BACT|nr:MAG: Protein grpE [uncultured bacterium (gcode 4)]
MTKKDENINEDNSLDLENILEWDIIEAEEAEERIEDEMKWLDKIQWEINILKESLARAQADYQNLVRRVERDKIDMWIYLTWNIIAKILPFVDNLERIIAATPEDMKQWGLFDWVKSTYAWIVKTLEGLWVKSFDSIWQEVDASLHDVMSQMPWEEGKIIQEFERWYMLGDKVIRHAKVVVGSGI